MVGSHLRPFFFFTGSPVPSNHCKTSERLNLKYRPMRRAGNGLRERADLFVNPTDADAQQFSDVLRCQNLKGRRSVSLGKSEPKRLSKIRYESPQHCCYTSRRCNVAPFGSTTARGTCAIESRKSGPMASHADAS